MAFRALLVLTLAPLAASEVQEVPPSEWCAWIPIKALEYVSDCKGTGTDNMPQATARCADWCLWVPGPAWKSIKRCYMCAASARPGANATVHNVTQQDSAAATEAVGEPKPEKATNLRGKSLVIYPTWCSTIPLGSLQYVPDCQGFRGTDVLRYSPDCTSWCQWVPSPSWQYVSACQGCYGEPPIGSPSGPYRGGCASWCQWVPTPSWQYVSGCAGCF